MQCQRLWRRSPARLLLLLLRAAAAAVLLEALLQVVEVGVVLLHRLQQPLQALHLLLLLLDQVLDLSLLSLGRQPGQQQRRQQQGSSAAGTVSISSSAPSVRQWLLPPGPVPLQALHFNSTLTS